MLFDTDVFIWLQKGNIHAAEVIESSRDRQISLQTYLELLQMAQNKEQHRLTKLFLRDFRRLGFQEVQSLNIRALLIRSPNVRKQLRNFISCQHLR